MSVATEQWAALVEGLEPHLSPEWTRHAREEGAQPWVRLILLVDAQHVLSFPQAGEKIASTMAELAAEREAERAGWTEIMERARERRDELRARLLEVAPTVLPEDLQAMFERSSQPVR